MVWCERMAGTTTKTSTMKQSPISVRSARRITVGLKMNTGLSLRVRRPCAALHSLSSRARQQLARTQSKRREEDSSLKVLRSSATVSPKSNEIRSSNAQVCSASNRNETDSADPGWSSPAPSLQVLLGVSGTIAAPILLLSAYTLGTTGCGLPVGPYGLYGAAEGVSYLLSVGLVAYSVAVKVSTGSGLPSGPSGILGAAEGLNYLALLLSIGAAVYQFAIVGAQVGADLCYQ